MESQSSMQQDAARQSCANYQIIILFFSAAFLYDIFHRGKHVFNLPQRIQFQRRQYFPFRHPAYGIFFSFFELKIQGCANSSAFRSSTSRIAMLTN